MKHISECLKGTLDLIESIDNLGTERPGYTERLRQLFANDEDDKRTRERMSGINEAKR